MNQVGLNTTNNIQQTLSLQVNLTGSQVQVANGSQAVNFTKTVAGDTKPVAGQECGSQHWEQPISEITNDRARIWKTFKGDHWVIE